MSLTPSSGLGVLPRAFTYIDDIRNRLFLSLCLHQHEILGSANPEKDGVGDFELCYVHEQLCRISVTFYPLSRGSPVSLRS